MAFYISQAKREQIFAKIALMGASGSGKTFSSLRMATGMLEALKAENNPKKLRNGKILMASTEASRGRYYANEFKYDILEVKSPHNPEMYVELIQYAVEQNYPILIIDSSSHEWEGKGGCLELHQLAGGNFQSWAKITPRHDKFIEAIADSEIHIIATMRGKDQYEIEKGEKTTVKKLGVGAQQRNGFEYEFTATFLLDQKTNTAESQKDNTHLFEHEGSFVITEKHGNNIMKWAGSGEEEFTPVVRETKSVAQKNTDRMTQVIDLCTELKVVDKDALMTLLKEYEEKGNPMKIKDESKLVELFGKLQAMKKEKIQ